MTRYLKINDEVVYATDAIVQVNRHDIGELVAQAVHNPRRRIRLCSHKNVEDKLHEMLIVHTRDTYIRPHKHPGKTESFHVMEGAADLIIFDEAGAVADVIRMGDYASGKTFYYRTADAYYHTQLIRSEVIVFHEATNGPFNRSDTVFAPWGPEESDATARQQFDKRVEGEVASFLRRRNA